MNPMSHFGFLSTDHVSPTTSSPSSGDLIAGSPVHCMWELEDAGGGVSVGVWESTPGKWRFANTHWEFFRVLAGVSILTEDVTEIIQTVRAGDSLLLRPGFSGTWEVIDTTRKEYVVREQCQ
ncbi:cupin domain-containing protein [Pectobacterium aroidearum]|uniref:cupin domain-containing protein n=1 Tax=Pectobacterium aroidearum TaxID=1201031 RepID=UPI0032EBBDC7